MNLLDLMTCLTPCVLEAGEKIMDVYYKDPKQELKNDGSPVTEADRASEKIILSSLKKLTPDVLIISEDFLHFPMFTCDWSEKHPTAYTISRYPCALYEVSKDI